ncbi:UNVERIFIED_CONTAM: hypothetical protein Cloal_2518 [Acetivibrio alkalicellulosi]
MRNKILISFWGPRHGQAGQTTNAVALATYMGVMYNIKTLIMHSQHEMSNMESAYFEKIEDLQSVLFDETGIDALERLAMTRQLTPANFSDYTKNLIEGRLDILIGTSKKTLASFESMSNSIQYILTCARQKYDVTICDLSSGDSFEITEKALKLSDIIVINLNQNIELLKSYFEREETEAIKDKTKIILLGNYEMESLYNKKNILAFFSIKEQMYSIPRNVNFMDYYNNHEVIKFFMSNYDVGPDDKNFIFIKELNELSRYILKELKLDSKYVEKPIEYVSLFSSIKDIFKKR